MTSVPQPHQNSPSKKPHQTGKGSGKHQPGKGSGQQPGKGYIKPANSGGKKNTNNGSFISKSKAKSKWKTVDCPPKAFHKYYLNKEYIEDVIREVVNVKFVDALHLADKRISDDGIIRLIDGIMDKKVEIKRLFFFKNDIGDTGAKKIAEFLIKSNRSVRELHLSHNRITTQGARMIFEAVKECGYPIIEKRPNKSEENNEKDEKITSVPLWLRLEWNMIEEESIETILKELGLVYCFSTSRVFCKPKYCLVSNCQLHLYVIHLQLKRVEESHILKTARAKAKLKTNNNLPLQNVPLLLFLDTNTVIHMMDGNTTKFFANNFNWYNLLKRSDEKQFGFTCFENDADKVCLLLTNTVMQEIDHHKIKSPQLRPQLNALLSDTGPLSLAATAKFLEVLGAHQGERLVQEHGKTFIEATSYENQSLVNDIALLNVALFWNAEIGETGTVVLVSEDKSLIKMAKQHLLPAVSLRELDSSLHSFSDVSWTGQVLRQCMQSATRSGGEIIGSPLQNKPDSILQELRNAITLTRSLLMPFAKVYIEFSLPYHTNASTVVLFGDFKEGHKYVMKKRTKTGGIGISTAGVVPDTETEDQNEPEEINPTENSEQNPDENLDLSEETEEETSTETPNETSEKLTTSLETPTSELTTVHTETTKKPDLITSPPQTTPTTTNTNEEWWIRLELEPRAYLFKYLIDSKSWFVHPQLPIVTDVYGNNSNLVVVPVPARTQEKIEEANSTIERWSSLMLQLPAFARK